MSAGHYQNNPKESPTAQALVLGEIDALVTFWPDIRDDKLIGPDVAFDLLAIWAHLLRFNTDTLDETLVAQLNELVMIEQEAICEHALGVPFPSTWIETAIRLDEMWDYIVDNEGVDDLENKINEHFELLDRESLVAYAIAKLRPALVTDERFLAFDESLQIAEDYLAENPYVFAPAAIYASSMLDAYRHDRHEFDEDLAETTLKHRSLQELIDEQENPRSLPRLDPNVLRRMIEESSSLSHRMDLPNSDTEPETKLVQLGPSGSAWLSFQLEFLLVELGRASSLIITFDDILINSGKLQLISRTSLSNKQFELRLSDGFGECKRSLKAVIEPFHFKVTGNSVPSIRVSLWFQGKQTSTVKTLKFEGNKF